MNERRTGGRKGKSKSRKISMYSAPRACAQERGALPISTSAPDPAIVAKGLMNCDPPSCAGGCVAQLNVTKGRLNPQGKRLEVQRWVDVTFSQAILPGPIRRTFPINRYTGN